MIKYMSKKEADEVESFKIIINKKHFIFLDNLSQKNKPLESCAILIGKRNNNQFIVTKIIPMENDEKSNIKFTINEEKLFAVYKKTESMNLSVVGIYHTHPSNPIPSKTDIKYMEINPVPWIINSTITGETKCFIYYDNKGVEEIELKVTD
jgi:[CysO sulfur-carrier protein]-S-L-cysteine hydrolase